MGVLIQKLDAHSIAAEAGLSVGLFITAIDGKLFQRYFFRGS
jgi:S1-C subfamily serine protease